MEQTLPDLDAAPLAPAIPDAPARALDLLQAGGPVVAILLVLSLAALTIVIAKLLQFRAARIARRAEALRAVDLHRSGRSGEALRCAAAAPGPFAGFVALALRGAHGDHPVEAVRAEATRHGLAVLEQFRGWFRTLEVIASLAPILGLLGTVLGMIAAFRRMEAAGSRVDPGVLSGGIWEALLTTAVGLAVAIPTVAVLSWLERRVERLGHAMDDALGAIFAPDLARDFAPESAGEPAQLQRAAPYASHHAAAAE